MKFMVVAAFEVDNTYHADSVIESMYLDTIPERIASYAIREDKYNGKYDEIMEIITNDRS